MENYLKELDLSLVIPCYNEMPLIRQSLDSICEVLDNTRLNYELIFVDDQSTDSTADFLRDFTASHKNSRLICHPKNTGRGRAVTDGIKASRGRIVGFNDIDLSTSACYIPYLYLTAQRGYAVVTAWRIYKIKFSIINRWLLSRGYNILMRALLNINLNDTETGCKFFNREKILPVLEQVKDNHWFWDTEIMVRSSLNGLKIIEVPTLFMRQPGKKSTVKIFRDSLDYFISLLKFRGEVKSIRKKNLKIS